MRRPPILSHPELQTKRQRWLYGCITLVFWLLYLYLWLPAVTLAGWAFGIWRGYDIFMIQQGLTAFRDLLLWYAAGVGIFAGLLVGWALINFVRFRGRERRRPVPPLELGEQAAYWGVPAGKLSLLRGEQVVVVTHDGRGRIDAVGRHVPAPRSPPTPRKTSRAEDAQTRRLAAHGANAGHGRN